MKTSRWLTASLFLIACAAPVFAQEHQVLAAPGHSIYRPQDIRWLDGPPSLPAGAKFAVLDGDPEKAGPFAMRLRFPDGYKVMPHWHPVDENVTVLKGTFVMGTGEKFDAKAGMELPPGGFSHMPKGTKHFALAKGETIIQVHGVGPFEIHYVNPADDPRKKEK